MYPAKGDGLVIGTGDFVAVAEGVGSAEGLDGALCQVVGQQGDLRDIRRVDEATGRLVGVEVRFLASELRPVRVRR
ncbi:hypothetical protein D2E76_28230 [Mycobacteroides abscessus]|uniref:Uncharacterized protein n=1 Tax=Mycobacteroides abscessus TaxID=36809 RepID=A0ABD7HFY4_9MYCO|nr:hypothetical protein D2E76_28230 [Mycobacteroides abscessus]